MPSGQIENRENMDNYVECSECGKEFQQQQGTLMSIRVRWRCDKCISSWRKVVRKIMKGVSN